MKTAVLATDVALTRSRLADYLELTKPRIGFLVLVTVAAGALLAGAPDVPLAVVFHAVLGTGLVAAGASALNHLLERDTDALMRRTANRPLPSGRLQPLEVLLFGVTLGIAGVAYLAVTLRQPTAALLAAFTFLAYVCVYTPLKSRSPLNTLVGAVPGALPPVIGWTAVRGEVSMEAFALFAILFLWQVPHFLAIAWMYREQYGQAGLAMLPVFDSTGDQTARQMTNYCLALIPVSLLPVAYGAAGGLYFVGAIALGVAFLASALAFGRSVSIPQARKVLHASLLYLPGLLALLVLDTALRSIAL